MKTAGSADPGLSALDLHLLNDFQHDFPLTERPYAELAGRVDATEAEVLAALERLSARGAVSRVGPVIRPHAIGASTLAAMRVPPDRLTEVARLVSSYPEVNHNYEREHAYNLWFVLAAPSARRVRHVLRDIEQRTGIGVVDLPLLEDYHIDLGFDLKWS